MNTDQGAFSPEKPRFFAGWDGSMAKPV